MITSKVFAAPAHIAYELLAKCRLLTLTGVDEDGELEWTGTTKQIEALEIEQEDILREWDAQQVIRKFDGVW